MSSPCNDTWTSKDKAWHFGVSLVLAIIYPPLAIVAAMGKEVYDQIKSGGHYCWKDVVADLVGVAVGSITHTLILLIILS